MDSISALNVFMRAAELRSFTDAGRSLGLSSSAVGKAVGRLEEKLSVRLFNRNTRNVSLTEQGNLLLERCHRIFSEVEAIEVDFSEGNTHPKGTLRVGLGFGGPLIMQAIEAFIETYPAIRVDLEILSRAQDMIESGLDVALHGEELGDCRLMSKTLATYQYVLVAAPSYLARAGRPLLPADLPHHACLHYRNASTGKLQPWTFDGAMLSALPVTAVASSFEPLVAMARAGLGIAHVPKIAVAQPVQDGDLEILLSTSIHQQQSLRAVWPSSRHLPRKLRAFIDFMALSVAPKPQPGIGRQGLFMAAETGGLAQVGMP